MTTSQVVMLTKGTILDDDIKKAQCIAIHFYVGRLEILLILHWLEQFILISSRFKNLGQMLYNQTKHFKVNIQSIVRYNN